MRLFLLNHVPYVLYDSGRSGMLLEVFLLLLVLLAVVALSWLRIKTAAGSTLRDVTGRILLITAHPDDECMFFAPTILSLGRSVRAEALPPLPLGRYGCACHTVYGLYTPGYSCTQSKNSMHIISWLSRTRTHTYMYIHTCSCT